MARQQVGKRESCGTSQQTCRLKENPSAPAISMVPSAEEEVLGDRCEVWL